MQHSTKCNWFHFSEFNIINRRNLDALGIFYHLTDGGQYRFSNLIWKQAVSANDIKINYSRKQKKHHFYFKTEKDPLFIAGLCYKMAKHNILDANTKTNDLCKWFNWDSCNKIQQNCILFIHHRRVLCKKKAARQYTTTITARRNNKE